MKVKLVRAPEGAPNFCFGLYRTDRDTEDCVEFVQSDWDYAWLARVFGWQACPCGGSDGTVDCPTCNRTHTDMLSEAFDFLCEKDGEEADYDPF